MAKEAVLTVRVPVSMKRQLEARAKRHRRSLSAQIATYLERGLEEEPSEASPTQVKILGLYEGTPVPADEDFAEARAWLRESLRARLERFK